MDPTVATALALLLVGLTGLTGTLLTPYGIDLWRFLAEIVRLNRVDISEWRPIWRAGVGISIIDCDRRVVPAPMGTAAKRSALDVDRLR